MIIQKENGFRKVNKTEEAIIARVKQAGIRAHSCYYCFCDEYNNLYSLQISGNVYDPVAEKISEECIQIIFVRSKVKYIQNSKPAGYYEGNYLVYESIVRLFDHFPEEV
jgi:hypothetical protein